MSTSRLSTSHSFDPTLAYLLYGYDPAVQQQHWYAYWKRVMDICGSLVILLLFLPLLLLAAVAIKLTDGGDIFFVQQRVGRGGKRFRCYKFRSMVPDAEARKGELMAFNEHDDPRTFKMRRDPRITWIGSILRRTSLDEFPQLWNVLRGEMSLVGPRPPVPAEVDLYRPFDHRRLEVLPGLTGIWQVSGRGDVPFDGQVQMDIQYIEQRCLALDMKLLLLTVPALLTGRGAY